MNAEPDRQELRKDWPWTALAVRSEIWLTAGGQVQHLVAGDTFALDREVPRAERYGSEGATYWVARRA